MYIDNEAEYGFLVTRTEFNTVSEEVVVFQEYLVDVMIPSMAPKGLPGSRFLGNTMPEPDMMGFDEIYMISLVRLMIFNTVKCELKGVGAPRSILTFLIVSDRGEF